jgi:hypothetical protein
MNNWTPEEDKILIKFYEKKSYKDIKEYLTNRSIFSIRSRVGVLGLGSRSGKMMSLAKKKNFVNKNYFDVPNIENSYWAGFIAADGCINNKWNKITIALGLLDNTHLDFFSSCVNYTGKIYINTNKGLTFSIFCVSGEKEWVDNLYKWWNITEKKSLTLEPPENLDTECRLAFIKGLIDGDGSIGYARNLKHISICGTYDICNYVKRTFDLLTPENNKADVRKNKTIFRYRISGSRTDKIFDILKALPTPELNRKWNIFNTSYVTEYDLQDVM